MKNFALIGVSGYVAPRHVQAIKETGNELVAVLDILDPPAALNDLFHRVQKFTSFVLFEQFLKEFIAGGDKLDYLVVCSPNHFHDAHVKFGLQLGVDVVCEKPVTLDPAGVDTLIAEEESTGRKVFTILQLRQHPAVQALRKRVELSNPNDRYKVDLTYIAAKNSGYYETWKGDEEKSGGIATNIGVHFFDLLLWIFGNVKKHTVDFYSPVRAEGKLELERADVNWVLSTEPGALPPDAMTAGKQTYRVIRIDGELFDFSEGYAGLHIEAYKYILRGKGIRLTETRSVIALVKAIRNISA